MTWLSKLAVVVISLAFMFSAFAPASLAEDDSEDPREIRIPVDPDVRLDIDLMSGKIEIRGWDKPEMRIRAQDGALGGLDIESNRGEVKVRGSRPGVGWLRIPVPGVGVDVEIDLPKQAFIDARTVVGPIEARDVEGRISLHAANGRIEVQGAPESAKLETMNANIEFEGRGSRVDARTVNGSIELSGVADEVVANTVSGSIEVEGDVVEHADLRALAGSIEFAASLAPGARVHCKTYSGDIRIEIPADTSAEFEVKSFSGRIENDLESAGATRWRGGPGQRLDFVAGEGDGRIRIESFSGRVEIRGRD